jgi:hypothetical protein
MCTIKLPQSPQLNIDSFVVDVVDVVSVSVVSVVSFGVSIDLSDGIETDFSVVLAVSNTSDVDIGGATGTFSFSFFLSASIAIGIEL